MAFTKSKRKKTLGISLSRANCLKLLCFVLLVFLTVEHIQISAKEQAALSKSQTAVYDKKQNNPNVLYSIGMVEYLSRNNIDKALICFTKAISSFSLYIPGFIRIGEIAVEQGESQKAERISTYVDSTAPDNSFWRWDRTMLAYSLQQHEILAENLSWFIENDRFKRDESLFIAASVWDDPGLLIDQLGAENAKHILTFFTTINDLEKARFVWDFIVEKGRTEEANLLEYINFLIRNEEIADAHKVWDMFTEPQESLNVLFNNDFRDEIIGSGFGWRMPKKLRRLISPVDGGLKIKFSGRKNLTFILRQLVPVEAGAAYTFSVDQRASNLTTDQLPFWFVHGYECEKFYLKGDMAKKESEWEKYSLDFAIPEDCHAVWLSLRRNESFHFDNKISGTLEIKNIELVQHSSPTLDNTEEYETYSRN